MVDGHLVGRLLRALGDAWPGVADLTGVDFVEESDRLIVRVRTTSPGRVIGRRGATADTIRQQLQAAGGDMTGDIAIELNIWDLSAGEPLDAPLEPERLTFWVEKRDTWWDEPPESPPWSDEPPEEPPPGPTREPRSPRPGGMSDGVALVEPTAEDARE